MSYDTRPTTHEQPRIADLLAQRRTVSFEFFPPKTADGIPSVLRSITRLSRLAPDFVSVTYGAGGSTRAFTEEIVLDTMAKTELVVMSHLTCVGQSIAELNEVVQRMVKAGVRNVMALRGDPPQGEDSFVPEEDGFEHATDLIRHIKSSFDVGIGGACYPERHIESGNLQQDIEYAKQKADLGADFLITQLFYDNAYFYDFMDKVTQAGLTVPVIPGLLPILSTSQIRRITGMCGATIPTELDRLLEKHADDSESVREIGIEHTSAQASDLWGNGVSGIHFYVLNRSYSVARILGQLELERNHAL